MYRIMKVVSAKPGYASLYQYLTTTIDGKVYPLEIETKEKLDSMVEHMLNEEGYSKSDFIIIEVIDYDIDATNYSDDDGDGDGDDEPDDGEPDDEPDPEDETTVYASNLSDIINAIDNDDVETIVLEDDIVSDSPGGIYINNGSTKTINLNGHNVTALCDNVDSNAAAFYVIEGTLIIDGDGFVDGGKGCPSDVAVWAYSENSKAIIKGGSYTVHKDKDNGGNSTIYAEAGATIEIYGGYFDNDANSDVTGPKRYVLNVQNNVGSRITCYGGEYVDQNPADGDDKDIATGSTFLAEGRNVTEREEDGHTIYTVTE